MEAKCNLHNMVCQLFCITCKKLFCCECAEDHSEHKFTSAKKLVKESEIKELSTKIREYKNELADVLQKLQFLLLKDNELISNIDNLKNEIMRKIQEIVSVSIIELKSKNADFINKIIEMMRKINYEKQILCQRENKVNLINQLMQAGKFNEAAKIYKEISSTMIIKDSDIISQSKSLWDLFKDFMKKNETNVIKGTIYDAICTNSASVLRDVRYERGIVILTNESKDIKAEKVKTNIRLKENIVIQKDYEIYKYKKELELLESENSEFIGKLAEDQKNKHKVELKKILQNEAKLESENDAIDKDSVETDSVFFPGLHFS